MFSMPYSRISRSFIQVCAELIEDDQILENFLTIRQWASVHGGNRSVAPAMRGVSCCSTGRRIASLPTDWFTFRSAAGPPGKIAGSRFYGENRTPRIPPEVLTPYLRGALFYVQVAANDIARRERAATARRIRIEDAGGGGDPAPGRLLQAAGRRRTRTTGTPRMGPTMPARSRWHA